MRWPASDFRRVSFCVSFTKRDSKQHIKGFCFIFLFNTLLQLILV